MKKTSHGTHPNAEDPAKAGNPNHGHPHPVLQEGDDADCLLVHPCVYLTNNTIMISHWPSGREPSQASKQIFHFLKSYISWELLSPTMSDTNERHQQRIKHRGFSRRCFSLEGSRRILSSPLNARVSWTTTGKDVDRLDVVRGCWLSRTCVY